jgi:hypothetical protein
MSSQIDHKAVAQGRVYVQYKDKPKFVQWMGVFGEMANQFEPVFEGISGSYDIDSATSYELDVLGNIVGVNRSFEGVLGLPSQELNNDAFRMLIRAKIAKNNSDATLDGIITALQFVVETDEIRINDPEDMSIEIVFGSLTSLETQVLAAFDIIPKPQGVNVAGLFVGTGTAQYGRSQYGRSQYSYGFGGS